MSQPPTDIFRTSCSATAPLELKISGPGWADGERRIFEHPFLLVGRQEHNCLRLDDGQVSRRHAYLQQLGGRVFCVDLGSRTGIRWGGKPRPSGWLCPEQGVQIGPFTLELPMDARGQDSADDRAGEDWNPLQDRANDTQFLPRITLEVGNEVVSRLCMNRAMVLVGSSPDCRIRLRDARVSRYHCSLVRTPQGVWLVDLLHGTGACLNGQSLRYALVKEGDRLEVGPYVLRVWYPEGRTETPPPRRVEIPIAIPVQQADDTSESGPRPSENQGSLEPAATETSALVSALQAELDEARERLRDVELLKQQLADARAEHARLSARVPELEERANAADRLWSRFRAAGAVTERLRVQLRAAESRQAEFETVRAECDRLREQAHALETQAAELTDLQARLEAAESNIRELDVVRGERDRWLTETQDLQTRLDSHSAEREEWRQRLEAVQQQLIAEREAVHAAGARLDQESATLQRVQTDLAARNAEHETALRQLKEAQDELTRLRDEARSLQAKLDQAHEPQRDIDALRQQLADVQAEYAQLRARVPELEERANATDRLWARFRAEGAETERLRVQLRAAESRQNELETVRAECDRLREQARVLEIQVAGMSGLQARLEAAEASARELDVVRGERDRWLAETHDLQTRLTSHAADPDHLNRLTAELRTVQAERDRLQTEQETSRHSAEQAWARVSELERALAEAAAAHATAFEEVRARWESERQALEARLELAHQFHDGAVQAAVNDAQSRAAAERQEWRQRLEGAESQIVWERRMFQEQSEKIRQLTATLQAERERLASRLVHAELRLRAVGDWAPDDLLRLRQQALRDQVFVQLSGIRMRHLLLQSAQVQERDAPTEPARPSTPVVSDPALVEEQRRLTAIAEEVQAAWGEEAAGPEWLSAITNPPGRAGVQGAEADPDTGGDESVKQRSAPAAEPDEGEASASSDDAAQDSAEAPEERQPAEDAHDGFPQEKDMQPEARPRLWRRIFGVRGK